MKRFCAQILMVVATAAAAPLSEHVVVHPVISTDRTWTGQPIVLPQHDARFTVTTYDIPGGAVLPEHKHPYQRCGYVMSGSLRITSTETGKTQSFKAGDFIVESLDQWHRAVNPGSEETRLLVIDITTVDRSNTVLKNNEK